MLNAAARAHCTRTQAVVSATAEHGPLGGVLCGMAHGASQLGWRCGSARSDMSVDARAGATSSGARTSALDRISTLQRVDVVRARRRRHGAQQWPSRWLGEYRHEVLARWLGRARGGWINLHRRAPTWTRFQHRTAVFSSRLVHLASSQGQRSAPHPAGPASPSAEQAPACLASPKRSSARSRP